MREPEALFSPDEKGKMAGCALLTLVANLIIFLVIVAVIAYAVRWVLSG